MWEAAKPTCNSCHVNCFQNSRTDHKQLNNQYQHFEVVFHRRNRSGLHVVCKHSFKMVCWRNIRFPILFSGGGIFLTLWFTRSELCHFLFSLMFSKPIKKIVQIHFIHISSRYWNMGETISTNTFFTISFQIPEHSSRYYISFRQKQLQFDLSWFFLASWLPKISAESSQISKQNQP